MNYTLNPNWQTIKIDYPQMKKDENKALLKYRVGKMITFVAMLTFMFTLYLLTRDPSAAAIATSSDGSTLLTTNFLILLGAEMIACFIGFPIIAYFLIKEGNLREEVSAEDFVYNSVIIEAVEAKQGANVEQVYAHVKALEFDPLPRKINYLKHETLSNDLVKLVDNGVLKINDNGLYEVA